MAVYLGMGMMAADLGIQLVNNGISVTRTLYNFGYNMIYGRPKTPEEKIEELTEQIQKLTKREEENVKRIEELTKQIEQMQTHRIRTNPTSTNS
jgi:tripartite-type tricarboxylate transporter receptor subunit TctC